jgi:multidrug efflux pump subunit AcrA (membrane-fusion protein)
MPCCWPIDGVVMETLAEPGQVVSAGQAVIRLARAGQREALVQLPETLRPPSAAKRWRRAMATKRSLSPQTAPAFDSADATTRTFEARYVLEGPLANAPLGATVTLHIKKQRGTPGHAGAAGCALRCGQRTRRLADSAQPARSHGSPSRC